MCDRTETCGCRVAVTRAYRELRQRNIPRGWAFDTAVKIYRWHHPEIPERRARAAVGAWLADEH